MPEISRFYGIIIQMFYNDYHPPHFHIEYGEYKAIINFEDEVIKGLMPKRALNLVFEWMEIHREQLVENWKLAKEGKPLNKIEQLK